MDRIQSPGEPASEHAISTAAPDAAVQGVERLSGATSAGPAARVRALFDAYATQAEHCLVGAGVFPCDAKDLVQQLFTIVSSRLDEIEVGREAGFVIQTALRLAANARRARARSREILGDEDAIEGQADAAPDPAEHAEAMEARAILDRFLSRQPEAARAAFILRELDGLSELEIADRLGTPRGTVASRIRRTRLAFERMIRQVSAGFAPRPTGYTGSRASRSN